MSGVDVENSKTSRYQFNISFKKFKNAIELKCIAAYDNFYSDFLLNGQHVEFICGVYLRRFLGRLPNEGENIYVSLVPVKGKKGR